MIVLKFLLIAFTITILIAILLEKEKNSVDMITFCAFLLYLLYLLFN